MIKQSLMSKTVEYVDELEWT